MKRHLIIPILIILSLIFVTIINTMSLSQPQQCSQCYSSKEDQIIRTIDLKGEKIVIKGDKDKAIVIYDYIISKDLMMWKLI